MRKEFKYIMAASMLFCLAIIATAGLRLPWSEEGAVYAIYGGSVGFYAAVAMGMFIVWKLKK
ncbi:MAG: hypothetical protein LBD04_02690 [Synergistaceae bacterium]|jgi:hypothetical protein|nr:hypothetical protein [Synergistaceae bacterium]